MKDYCLHLLHLPIFYHCRIIYGGGGGGSFGRGGRGSGPKTTGIGSKGVGEQEQLLLLQQEDLLADLVEVQQKKFGRML